MRASLLVSVLAVLFVGWLDGQTASDPNEGCRLVRDAGTGEYSVSWWGRAGRTYFIQVSEDLMEWHYINEIVSGGDGIDEWGFTSTSERFFVRLRHTDATTGGNPATADFDADGMTNGWEIEHGLDPFRDDAAEDADGDRIPNVYEFANNTDPASAASQPSPHAIVDPPNAAISSTDNIYATIQAAVTSVPTTTSAPASYHIVTVRAGTYPEDVTISGRRVLLMSSEPGGNPTIAPTSASEPLEISGASDRTIVRDFTLSGAGRPSTVKGRGVLINLAASTTNVRLTDCVILGNDNGSNTGAGIKVDKGTLALVHCTAVGNVTTGQGRSLYLGSSTNTSASVTNCILWSGGAVLGAEIHGPGTATVAGSLLKASGAVDPLLDVWGFLTPQSASPLNAGVTTPMSKVDIHGDARGSPPDIGADEYRDSDADGLPDWWEQRMIGNLAANGSSNLDADTLSNAQEYAFASSPLDADTDDDGALDSAEYAASSNPRDTDTDDDKMTDGFEILHGLDPLDYRDALADKDGDRIPNLYEQARGTLPGDANSKPSHDYLVDSSQAQTSTVKTTINAALSAAVAAAGDYKIIRVAHGTSGIYTENLSVSFTAKPILILGDAGYNPPTISVVGNRACVSMAADGAVLDGFIITHFSSLVPYEGITAYFSGPKAQGRIVNCIITGNTDDYGAGIDLQEGELCVAHSTICRNRREGENGPPSLGAYVRTGGHLFLQNSIVWNVDGGTGGHQVGLQTGGNCTVTNSIIGGGEHGAFNINPLLDSGGRLMSGSPAINHLPAVPLAVSSKDIHNELRDSNPDLGADEFFDSDADTLPDRWEQLVFGNLSHAAGADEDADGLTNFGEYMAGLNPLVADTDSDAIGDLAEAVAAAGDVYVSAAQLADDDEDGLTLAQEQLLGTNPNVWDTNGDGVSDGASRSMGLSPTGNDPDGDGLSTTAELAKGTSPIVADTDGDGVSDSADAFPLDPSASSLTSGGGDTTPPIVTLTKPPGAVPLP